MLLRHNGDLRTAVTDAGDTHLYKAQALTSNSCYVCHNLETLGKDRDVEKDVRELLDAAMKKATESKRSLKSRPPASRGAGAAAGARVSPSQGLRGSPACLLFLIQDCKHLRKWSGRLQTEE